MNKRDVAESLVARAKEVIEEGREVDLSQDDLRACINSALNPSNGENRVVYGESYNAIVDIYDKYVVYRRGGYDRGQLYIAEYTIDASGKCTLGKETRARKVYIPMTDAEEKKAAPPATAKESIDTDFWGPEFGLVDEKKSKKPRLGSGERFKNLVADLVSKGHSEESAKRIAAAIGRKTYGGAKMARMSAAGRK